MNGGVGRAGAHYRDADLGKRESSCCREVTLKASPAADKSALRLSCRASAGE